MTEIISNHRNIDSRLSRSSLIGRDRADCQGAGGLGRGPDRGQIEDWFGSAFICWMPAIGIIGWSATVAWEIRLKEPKRSERAW